MVGTCTFGLGDQATEWLAVAGTSVLKHYRHITGSLGDQHVATATPWWSSNAESRVSSAVPTAFDEKHLTHESDLDGGEEHAKATNSFSCFPASASVYVKDRGPVDVCALRQGDFLLSGNAERSSLCFSPFLGHMHVESDVCKDYVVVRVLGTQDRPGATLAVSAEHFIFAADARGYVPQAVQAATLKVGDWLSRVSCDGDLCRAQISNISYERRQGCFAPLTANGTVVVNGTLCSCYADTFQAAPGWLRRIVATHEAAHNVLLPWRLACTLGLDSADVSLGLVSGPGAVDGRDTSEKASKTREGIHPYCRALLTFPALVQTAAA